MRCGPRQRDDDAVGSRFERQRLAAAKAPAQLGEAARECQRQQQRIGDRLPGRQEGGRDQRRRQARLQFGDRLRAVQVREGDAVVGARLPAGLRGRELGLALVQVQHAVAAQHVGRAGGGQHRVGLDDRQVHQRGLGRCAGLDALGEARAPEVEQPGCDARQVGGRDRQRAQRVEQPARRLAQDAGRGQRHDVGEGEGAGVAAARLGRDPGAIDHRDLAAFLLQAQRDGQADAARADHQHVARQLGRGHRRQRQVLGRALRPGCCSQLKAPT